MVPPRIESLLQSKGTYDSLIIIWFGDVYMLDSTTLFVRDVGMETPQFFNPTTVIDSAATVRSDFKTYAEKCMLEYLVHCCCLDYIGSGDNSGAMHAITKVCK